MADPQPPPEPVETTSYSDPLYDRLDAVAKSLGKRWGIVLLAVVIAVVIAVVLRTVYGDSPAAASAAAYRNAANIANERPNPLAPNPNQEPANLRAAAALAALVNDDAVIDEFKARAALEAGRLYLLELKPSDASPLLDKAKTIADTAEFASADDKAELLAAIGITQAANFEALGNIDQAVNLYKSVASTYRSIEEISRPAEISAALAHLVQAGLEDESTDAGKQAASDLRFDALNILERYKATTGGDSGPFTAIATYKYYETRRRFPELAKRFDKEVLNIETPADSWQPYVEPSVEEPAETSEAAPSETTPAAEAAPAVTAPAVTAPAEATPSDTAPDEATESTSNE